MTATGRYVRVVLGVTANPRGPHRDDRNSIAPAGQPALYGVMTEEINQAYEAALRGTRPQPRVPRTMLTQRALVARPSHGSTAKMAIDPKEPLNTDIGTSLRLRDTGLDRSGRYTQRGLLGLPSKPTPATAVFYARRARIHCNSRSLDSRGRRPADLRTRPSPG